MNTELYKYSAVMLIGVFISSVSQVLLKKSSERKYDSAIAEYVNPLVITAYAIFFIATLLTIYAYKVVPLSMGPVLESTGYIYVTVFGAVIFKEKVSLRKIIALTLIILGIIIYSVMD